jgi:hypothetical protein
MDGKCTACVEGIGAYKVLVGKPEGNRSLWDPDIRGSIILRWFFRKRDVGVWTGLSRLTIEKVGGHLWMRQRTFGFHKMRGTAWLAANRLASHEGLCSMQKVTVNNGWGASSFVENFQKRWLTGFRLYFTDWCVRTPDTCCEWKEEVPTITICIIKLNPVINTRHGPLFSERKK